jgi:hypothetical protein
MIGLASASCFVISGSSMSSGSLFRPRITRSRTSWAATSTSRSRVNSTVMVETCSRDWDTSVRIPSMPLISSSRGSVTSVSTT